jgi:Carbohydrate-selective porin, OprB family/S-layer homology domain
MTSKRFTPALLAASIVLTGASQLLFTAPANAITSVDELSDANRNHWAFEALRDLVEKYDVIEGYPDRTFRGNKAPTRYEMAAALNQLTKKIGEQLARLGSEKADKKDLATLARLQDEFRTELGALAARTSALETRAAAIEAKNGEQDNRLTLLEKTQIHGDMTFGGIADIQPNGVDDPACGGECNDGIKDGISAIGRLRLSINVPVKDDNEESKVGEGSVYTRLVAAFGRNNAQGMQSGNLYNGGNSFSGYSRIAGDTSTFNEGISRDGVVGGNALRQNLYVESAYYKQHFKSGIPLLTSWLPGVWDPSDDWKTTGDLYVGVVPWRFLFDKSPFRGNELTQFQNSSFVNTPGIAVNSVAPTVAYQWHQQMGKSANLDLTGAVSSVNTGDVLDGLSVTSEARLNYQTAFLGENFTKPGSLYFGGYHVFNAGNSTINGFAGDLQNRSLNDSAFRTNNSATLFARQDSTNALYAGWSQEYYKGIGTQVSYMLAQNGPNNLFFNSTNFNNGANTARLLNTVGVGVRQAITGSLTVPMAAVTPASWGREKDAFGVAYGMIDLQEGNNLVRNRNFRDRNEQLIEVFYRWQVNDSISIVPSYQMIFNGLGLGANGINNIIGLRTNYTF